MRAKLPRTKIRKAPVKKASVNSGKLIQPRRAASAAAPEGDISYEPKRSTSTPGRSPRKIQSSRSEPQDRRIRTGPSSPRFRSMPQPKMQQSKMLQSNKQPNNEPRGNRPERPAIQSPSRSPGTATRLAPRPVSHLSRPAGIVKPKAAKPKENAKENTKDKQVVLDSLNSDDEVVRLSKLMTERGLCSRREADDLIARGQVLVDGQVTETLGTKVARRVQIELLPHAVSALQKRVTIILNKPIGYVSGQPEDDYEPAVRLIKPENQDALPGELNLSQSHFDGLAPAGRLDIDSQGLLVFTQNGTVAKLLVGHDSQIEKEYLVRVTGSLPDFALSLLNHGLALDGEALKPALVEWLNDDQLRFVLREGKKRQIRRMCEAVGLTVVGLKRVRIGNVRLGNLAEGSWRYLRPDEHF